MKLGSYTFDRLPTAIDGIIRPEKRGNRRRLKPMAGWRFFFRGWGCPSLEPIASTWRAMPVSMFNDIDSLYQADAMVTWEGRGMVQGKHTMWN